MITIERIHHPDELKTIVKLEMDIWGLDPIDAVPSHLLVSNTHNGGAIHVAKDNGTVIGFSLGLPARRDNKLILWSQMAGVRDNYQGQGIGLHIKQAQYQWAKSEGFAAVGWTFDPLKTRNANFNLNRLNALIVRYHRNFYGEMNDNINNSNLPSDRLEVLWPAIFENLPPVELSKTQIILDHNRQNHTSTSYDDYVAVATPTSPTPEWQMAIADSMSLLFEAGYVGFQIIRHIHMSYYVFAPKQRFGLF